MCTDCETKGEYDRSHKELSKFLRLEETVEAIGIECIYAMEELQDTLRGKEAKLSHLK